MSEVERLQAEVASLRAQLQAVQAAQGPAGQPATQGAHEGAGGGSAGVSCWQGEPHGLTKAQVERYCRQLILPAFGVGGAPSPALLPAELTCVCQAQSAPAVQRKPSCAEPRCWWWVRAVWGRQQLCTWLPQALGDWGWLTATQ